MIRATLTSLTAIALALGMLAGRHPAIAQETSAEAVVDAMQALAGKPPKTRAGGAKGVCVKGSFAPAAEAGALTLAAPFAKAGPLLARFSMGGGNPKISDKTKPVTRGFAMRFNADKDPYDLVVISAPMFGAKTPAQLLANLEVRKPGPDGKPDADKIKAFVDANPEVTRQAAWLNARPIPASWAATDYWALHAFTMTNAKGESRIVKLKVLTPAAATLSDDEAKAKSDNFYSEDLTDRLAKAPVQFDLVAIPGAAGDVLDDITVQWKDEDARQATKLGTISIAALEAAATCDEITFDPTNLPKGIAPQASDTMLPLRSPTYALSLVRRAQ